MLFELAMLVEEALMLQSIERCLCVDQSPAKSKIFLLDTFVLGPPFLLAILQIHLPEGEIILIDAVLRFLLQRCDRLEILLVFMLVNFPVVE